MKQQAISIPAQKYRKKQRPTMAEQLFTSLLFVLIIICLFAVRAYAANADISRSYQGDTNIVPGSLVSLDEKRDGYVVLANSKSPRQLIGVAVKVENSLIALNVPSGNVQVSVNGLANTLVSTMAGSIEVGDLVAESSISGVGAKAKPGDKAIGIAQKQFSSDSTDSKQQTITDAKGKTAKVNIGYIPVLVSFSNVPGVSGYSQTAIEKWATGVAGRSVSLTRIIFCGIIAIIALSALVIMVYSSIRNSIIAVSRNPLAKPVIFEALAQVMSMVILVSIISILTMYLVIRV